MRVGLIAGCALALVLQLLHGLHARTGHGLVGADHDALHAIGPMQRRQRHHQLDGAAVRVRDDALVTGQGVRIDLRYHERHVRVHAPGAAVVDHRASRLREARRPFQRSATTGTEQRDIGPRGHGILHIDHGHLFPAEMHGGTHAARTGHRQQFAHRETAFLQHLQHDPTDQPGGPDHSDLHDECLTFSRCRKYYLALLPYRHAQGLVHTGPPARRVGPFGCPQRPGERRLQRWRLHGGPGVERRRCALHRGCRATAQQQPRRGQLPAEHAQHPGRGSPMGTVRGPQVQHQRRELRGRVPDERQRRPGQRRERLLRAHGRNAGPPGTLPQQRRNGDLVDRLPGRHREQQQ